ncbi:MAG: putative toxin-antitoxin system toxin component, PIN family [Chitinivibrionales bacterium]|nr:putative toxin-antitoxin system toxin component, PIN family [Chitinivibrionales bacterium]
MRLGEEGFPLRAAREHFSWEVFWQFCATYSEVCLHTQPRRRVRASRDLRDNMFLSCAITAMAPYLISGDPDLLGLGQFEAVKIVTPRPF